MNKLFPDLADARFAEKKMREQFEHLPFSSFYVSTLGGEHNASILFTLSLDQKELWANKILENARHAKFHLEANGKLEKISGHKVAAFRSVRVASVQEAIRKLWEWLEKSRKEGAPKRYGVFKWREDGKYSFPVKEYKSENAAEKFALKMNNADANSNFVVRTVNPVPLAKGTKTNPASRKPYTVPGTLENVESDHRIARDRESYLHRRLKDLERELGFYAPPGYIPTASEKNELAAYKRNAELATRRAEKIAKQLDILRRKNPVPLAKGTKRKRSDVRIVQNKLLGGWFLVRGAHDTPLTGRFNTKAEAQAELDWRKRHRVNPTKKATMKKTVRKANPTPRADIVKQTTRLSELLGIPIGLRNPLGQYQLHFKNRKPMSPLLLSDDMKNWLHGAIQSALVCGKK